MEQFCDDEPAALNALDLYLGRLQEDYRATSEWN
jgi:hypothetical protein